MKIYDLSSLTMRVALAAQIKGYEVRIERPLGSFAAERIGQIVPILMARRVVPA